MENHPIPQDVTGFQFKLIGNMTVKQFAYLATGSVVAWLLFSLPISSILKLPLSAFSFLLGFCLAFIPIEQRPMDVMLRNFIKAFFTPNLYVFQKVGGVIVPQMPPQKTHPQTKSTQPLPKDKLREFLKKSSKPPKTKIDEKEMVFFQSLGAPPHIITLEEESLKQKEEPQEIIPSPEKTKEEKEALEKEALLIKKELQEATVEEVRESGTKEISGKFHQRVLQLEKELNEVLFQKQELEKQLLHLQEKLEIQKQQVFTPTGSKLVTPNVRLVSKAMGKTIGLPIAPDVPNLIVGIIKDPRGNILPNILVEIKDKEGNPVRAFKTNGLGQFAAATPLSNGVYTVFFEDPESKHKFDTIELTVAGEIIAPIEVISQDQREELRRELFK